jgi:hypothetical protein
LVFCAIITNIPLILLGKKSAGCRRAGLVPAFRAGAQGFSSVCAAPATCALANKLNFNASIGLIGRFRAPGLAHCGAVQTLSIPFDKNFDLPWDFRACKKCRPDKANPG